MRTQPPSFGAAVSKLPDDPMGEKERKKKKRRRIIAFLLFLSGLVGVGTVVAVKWPELFPSNPPGAQGAPGASGSGPSAATQPPPSSPFGAPAMVGIVAVAILVFLSLLLLARSSVTRGGQNDPAGSSVADVGKKIVKELRGNDANNMAAAARFVATGGRPAGVSMPLDNALKEANASGEAVPAGLEIVPGGPTLPVMVRSTKFYSNDQVLAPFMNFDDPLRSRAIKAITDEIVQTHGTNVRKVNLVKVLIMWHFVFFFMANHEPYKDTRRERYQYTEHKELREISTVLAETWSRFPNTMRKDAALQLSSLVQLTQHPQLLLLDKKGSEVVATAQVNLDERPRWRFAPINLALGALLSAVLVSGSNQYLAEMFRYLTIKLQATTETNDKTIRDHDAGLGFHTAIIAVMALVSTGVVFSKLSLQKTEEDAVQEANAELNDAAAEIPGVAKEQTRHRSTSLEMLQKQPNFDAIG